MYLLPGTAINNKQYLLLIEVCIHFQHHLFCMRCRLKKVIITFVHGLINSSLIPVHSNQTTKATIPLQYT